MGSHQRHEVGHRGGDHQEEGCVNDEANCTEFVTVAPVEITDDLFVGENLLAVRVSTAINNSYAGIYARCAEPARPRPEPVWALSRYAEVMDRADALIRSATHSVYLSAWAREVDRLRPALDALGPGLQRVLHSPEAIEPPPAGFSCWCDDFRKDPGKAGWSHKILLVVDRRHALVGGAEPHADNHVVVTTNPSIVGLATNHLVLDVTLLGGRTGRDPNPVVAPMIVAHVVDPA